MVEARSKLFLHLGALAQASGVDEADLAVVFSISTRR